MRSLVTNLLEPISFFVYFLALAIRQPSRTVPHNRLLMWFYALGTLLHGYASLQVYRNQSNIWVYDVVLALSSVVISHYFYRQFHSTRKKLIIVVLAAVVLFYALAHQVLSARAGYFNSLGYALLSMTVCVYTFLFFHQALNNVSDRVLYHQFTFWLVTGYIIYYLGAFLIFLTYYYFTKKIIYTYTEEERTLMSLLWGVHNSLLFAGAALTLTGSIWTIYRKK